MVSHGSKPNYAPTWNPADNFRVSRHEDDQPTGSSSSGIQIAARGHVYLGNRRTTLFGNSAIPARYRLMTALPALPSASSTALILR